MRIHLIVAAFGAALALALFGATLDLSRDAAPRVGLRLSVQGLSVQASVAAF
jgi:hypothetical protein